VPTRADFNGIWSTEQGILWDTAAGRNQPQNPPFTAEYAALYRQALHAAAIGRPLADPPASCLPPGTPRIMASPFPIEILVTPGVVYMLFVFMDSKAPKSMGLPTFNGYSTGRWEGNDLLIDTVELRGDTVLDTTHLGHSEQLQVHERLHLRAPDQLEAQITLIDPKAFTKPWTVVRTYAKKPGEQIIPYVCEENNRNPVDKDGVTGFIGSQ
jgi:hypothetical protein